MRLTGAGCKRAVFIIINLNVLFWHEDLKEDFTMYKAHSKIISVILAVMLVVSMCCLSAGAADDGVATIKPQAVQSPQKSAKR